MTSHGHGDREPAPAGPDPEQLVATAIAALPEEFGDFTVADLDAAQAVTRELLAMQAAATQRQGAVLGPVLARMRDGEVLRDVLTEAEAVELAAATRECLAVERALTALAEYERRIGVPWPVPELRVTTSEDPDAELAALLGGSA